MAAKTLEEVRSALSAEEQALFDKTLKANPELKDGWMRQDDYSRRMTELSEQKKQYEEGIEYAESMKAWADVNVPRWDSLVEKGYIDKETGEERFSAQREELERQLQEARNSIGGDMDPEELNRRVTEIVKGAGGGLTKSEMTALIAEETRKLAAEQVEEGFKKRTEEFNEKTVPFVAGFSTQMGLAALKYERETGEEFTEEKQKAFFDEMSKRQNFSPRAVMDEFLKPVRDKKTTEAEVERRVQEELNKRRMPGGGGESYLPNEQDRGNIQKMMEQQGGSDDFEAKIMESARKASAELRSEGK